MRTKKEYGGFLPLELNPGREWFAEYAPHFLRFNSVKAALVHLLAELRVLRICLPYYYCPTTISAIKKTGVQVLWYHIGEDLLPQNLPDEPDAAVLLVNYFGVLDEPVSALAERFCAAKVIVDNAHSFYCKPIKKEGGYTLYSAKKFFGVPDGAYLIGAGVQEEPVFSRMADQAQYLLTSYEDGTNAAYARKKQVDAALAEHYGPMSLLAKGLLENVDYQRVFRCRRDNFARLHEALAAVNTLTLPTACGAYHYPFLPDGEGERIKQKLVQERIYVPTLWTGENLLRAGNEFEKKLSKHAVFLPMDQRYDTVDMEYVIYKVRECLDEDT